ncbi:MAG: hypothetical protein HKN16_11385, partial [Saprospiraceae bacterium]|nr:hypothetical protein [Saprospiraceae bacterium]
MEPLNSTKQLLITLCISFGIIGISNAQTCAGNSFDLDENDFPQTCVSSNGADGTATTATFDHDFATNTGGLYSDGGDGTPDVTVTLTTACSFPNGTNGTTTVGACLGPNGLLTNQSPPHIVTNDPPGPPNSSDFGGTTVNDNPCANCWVVVEYDFINGFMSTADGFDLDWSSMNGGTEGYEAWGGWVEGPTFTAPTVTVADLATYCHAQALAGETFMTWITGVGPGGALPAGVFGADAITGDGAATVCPLEEPASSSGPNSTVGTGMSSGAIPANWGLTATDEITKVTMIYLMSNSNGDDCDADGVTSVNTSPSGSLSTVDFCVPDMLPAPLCPDPAPETYTITSIDVSGTDFCSGSSISATANVSGGTSGEDWFIDWQFSWDGTFWQDIGTPTCGEAGTETTGVFAANNSCDVGLIRFRAYLYQKYEQNTTVTDVEYDGDFGADIDGVCFLSPNNTCVDLMLTAVNPTSRACIAGINYAADGTTEGYAPSWASEAHLGFIAPDGTCINIDGETVGFMDETGPWSLDGMDLSLNGASADGIFQACFVDDFDDFGIMDGIINNLCLQVFYFDAPDPPVVSATANVFPLPMSFNVVDDGTTCGTPTVQLVAADPGLICETLMGPDCVSDGDMWTPDFAGSPTGVALSGA